ncbi:hypothetical protein [Kibdelosporangium philippinense]|uniref:hypothetical protein n=1 Tax=Kibdelosporangium philippinense TaxID=211113 RepID=UPI003610D2A0
MLRVSRHGLWCPSKVTRRRIGAGFARTTGGHVTAGIRRAPRRSKLLLAFFHRAGIETRQRVLGDFGVVGVREVV